MLLKAYLIMVYGVIALIVMGIIASEGIDEDGNVYDDTAITCGFGLGLVWPITVVAYCVEPVLVSLGRAFN
jgi:hypothetical protein